MYRSQGNELVFDKIEVGQQKTNLRKGVKSMKSKNVISEKDRKLALQAIDDIVSLDVLNIDIKKIEDIFYRLQKVRINRK